MFNTELKDKIFYLERRNKDLAFLEDMIKDLAEYLQIEHVTEDIACGPEHPFMRSCARNSFWRKKK